MSQLHREGRFDGVERADSLTWNPHKLLGALLQCATFHLKEEVRDSKNIEDKLSRAQLLEMGTLISDRRFPLPTGTVSRNL